MTERTVAITATVLRHQRPNQLSHFSTMTYHLRERSETVLLPEQRGLHLCAMETQAMARTLIETMTVSGANSPHGCCDVPVMPSI